DCAPTVQDIRYLLDEVRMRWRNAVRHSENVRSAYAGLRPLVRGPGSLRAASRESRLLVENGLYSVVGGKFTTYRAIAERTLDRVLRDLGKAAHACSTRERPLPGSGAGTRE